MKQRHPLLSKCVQLMLAGVLPLLAVTPWRINPRTDSLLESLGIENQSLFHLDFEKDANGAIRYVWLAGTDGLHRYDGYSSKRFGVKDGLPSDFVRAVLIARDGKLWVATNKGAGTFDGKTFSTHGSETGLAGQNVRRIIEDREGTLWFASDRWEMPNAKAGLSSLRGGAWRSWHVEDGLPSDYVVDQFTDSAGRKFVVTLEGIARLEGERWVREPLPPLPRGVHWDSAAMSETPNDGVVLSNGSSVWVLKAKAWLKLGNPPEHPYGITVTSAGKLLIAGDTKAATKAFFEWTGAQWARVSNEFRTPRGWGVSLREAPDGSIWYVGVDCLERWQPKDAEWQFLPGVPGRHFLDSKDVLWSHGRDQSLSEFDGANWTRRGIYEAVAWEHSDSVWGVQGSVLTRWRSGQKSTFGETDTGIRQLMNVAIDGKGTVWVIGGDRAGKAIVSSYDGRIWRRRRALVPLEDPNRLFQGPAPGGGIWYLTKAGPNGGYMLTFAGDTVDVVPVPADFVSLYDNRLDVRPDGEIWLNNETGLHRKQRGKEWASLPGLPEGPISSIGFQGDEAWFVMDGALGGRNGLLRLSNGVSKFYPTEGLTGFQHGADGSLLAGGAGRFWVIPPNSGSEPFAIRLPDTQQQVLSVQRGRDGVYWAETPDGLARFQSDGVPRQVEVSGASESVLSGQPFAAVAEARRRFASGRNRPGFEYSWRLDQGPWSTFSHSFHYQVEGAQLTRGKHTVFARVLDNGLDKSLAPAAVEFEVHSPPIQSQPWFALTLILAAILMAVISGAAISARHQLARQAKAALGLSERRYQQIVETAQEGIATIDSKGVCTMANQEFARIVGRPMEQILNRHYRDWIDPTLIAEVNQLFERKRQGLSDNTEMEVSTPTGLRYVAVGQRPIPPSDGQFLGVLLTLTDLTGRKQAEDAIKRSEANYRQLFESSPNPMMLVDRETLRFQSVNDAACEVYGYSREEFAAITMLDLQVSSGVESCRQLFAGPLVEGPVVRQHRKKDGSAIEAEVYAHDQQFEGRACRHIHSIDKTEEIRSKNKLNESQTILAIAQEIAHIGSYQLRLPSVPGEPMERQWSDEMFRLMGLDPRGATPPEFTEKTFVHPDDIEVLNKLRCALIENGLPIDCEHRIIRADGSIRHVRSTGCRLDLGGPRLIGTMQDITEYRALEEQVRQSQRLDSIGRLAGGIAHDFNNLLTVINGYSTLVLRKLEPGTRLHGDIKLIAEAGHEAAELTRRLLAFGRKQLLRPVALDLNQVVKDASMLLERMVGEDVRLVTQLSPGPLPVRADVVQLNQVLLNLSTNARDAMPRGGTLTMATSSVMLDDQFAGSHPGASSGPHVRLVVSDTGAGMDKGMLGRIFDPFFTTKDRSGGTGLGLATVYGIIQQTGGSIHVESALGEGTAFRIFLPALALDAVYPEPNHSAASGDAGRKENGKLVLLVEDQQAVRRFIAGILIEHGYRVLQAANGREALSMLEALEEDPGLLLTDVVMPGMTGFELVQEIAMNRAGKPLPILYMSGYADGKLDAGGARPRGITLLEKPFSREDLLNRVAEAMSASV